MFNGIFNSDVTTAEIRTIIDPSILWPTEAEIVKHSVRKRRVEFAAGRLCARRALSRFGVSDFPLLKSEAGNPIWPHKIVGSITHTEGFCGVALGLKSMYAGIGIDVERISNFDSTLLRSICTAEEIHKISCAPTQDQQTLGISYFCGKEAFYKCQYPITTDWLDFHEVQLDIQGTAFEVSIFNSRIANKLPSRFNGRICTSDGFLAAGIVMY